MTNTTIDICTPTTRYNNKKKIVNSQNNSGIVKKNKIIVMSDKNQFTALVGDTRILLTATLAGPIKNPHIRFRELKLKFRSAVAKGDRFLDAGYKKLINTKLWI